MDIFKFSWHLEREDYNQFPSKKRRLLFQIFRVQTKTWQKIIESHIWKPMSPKLQPKKRVSGDGGAKAEHILRSRGSSFGFMGHAPGPSAFNML